MVARDDSVIRGSLIACLIFLVLSFALNFFLWRNGNLAEQDLEAIQERLRTNQQTVTEMEDQNNLMKSMLGVGGFSADEIEEMKQNVNADPEMQEIESQFTENMSYFGPEVEPQNQNYPNLPEYLVNAIRDLNVRYKTARDEVEQLRAETEAKIENAREQQQLAETQRDELDKKLVSISEKFDEDRTRMNREKEETRDRLEKTVLDFNDFRKTATDENNRLAQQASQLKTTIESQKLQLNRLRGGQFETTQGEIRYVIRGGNVVTINLGSADELRPGVTFGVIDGDETRLKDAKVKGTIQVTQIQGPHLATARVIARPEIRNPIIPGDKIYSPFWAPGRSVKIALAGDIDIDGDGRPDNEAIKGQIKAAGAEVVAEISSTGVTTGELDPSIRFLVIGESPTPPAGEMTDAQAEQERIMGLTRAKAAELGLTVIPAWKLDNYLKTIDNTLTTPLGSAAKAEDFPPEYRGGSNRLPTDISEIYKRQTEGMQQGDSIGDIVSP